VFIALIELMLCCKSLNADIEEIMLNVFSAEVCAISIDVLTPKIDPHGLLLPKPLNTPLAHWLNTPLLKSCGWNVFI
jgi:hypothetical protein